MEICFLKEWHNNDVLHVGEGFADSAWLIILRLSITDHMVVFTAHKLYVGGVYQSLRKTVCNTLTIDKNEMLYGLCVCVCVCVCLHVPVCVCVDESNVVSPFVFGHYNVSTYKQCLYSLRKTPGYWYKDSHYKFGTVVRLS